MSRQPLPLLFFAALAGLALVAVATNRQRWWGRHEAVPVRLVAGAGDRERARFGLCGERWQDDCVVDGDTIHYRGARIRVADINAPEVSEPKCDYELDLGEKATDRLLGLLNEGPFTLRPLPDRDEDRYGRKLRTITRGGRSLGEVLVAEGLAERWRGYRRDWCT